MSFRSAALIGAKFHPPAVDARQVTRRPLLDAIAQSRARLVLVRAPAGFGKTTLLAQARQQLEQQGLATVWITLDAADNDPSRLLVHLAAALGEVIDVGADGDDAAPPRAVGEFALRLLERVAVSATPFALVLDEFEVLKSAGVTAFVTQLLDALPNGACVLVGSRALPDLRLGRLRASGKLLEIDAQRLRFGLDETRAFFAERAGAALEDAQVQLLHDKTEGWAAALWLSWLAIEHHPRAADFIAGLSGTEGSLSDYLAEEVLAQMPPTARRLLLRTSILREISAPLCRALVPELDGEEDGLLAQLALSNAFLIPLDGRAGQWRYHHLFAGFLRAQLQREDAAAVPALHRAAAGWFIAQGRPIPAVDHFIAAGELGEATALIAREAMPLLMQGRLRLVSRWFDALPANALAAHPGLQVARAWASYYTRGPQAALALIDDGRPIETGDPETCAHRAGLAASMLALLDRWEDSHAQGVRSLHLAASPSAFANGSLVNVTATAATVLGLFPEARALLARARQGQGAGPSAFHRMYSETVEGMIDLLQGRLRQARARFHLAVQTTQQNTLDAAHGNAWAGLLYAVAVYDANDLAQAKRLLQVYLPLARDAWLPDHLILGHRTLARIAFSEGEVDHAFQGLSELEYLGHERQLPRLVAAARLERARLLLMQGHAEAAADELRHAGDAALWRTIASRRHLGHDTEDLEIGELRWQALAGDARRAAGDLDAAATRAARHGLVRRVQQLRLLQALAMTRAGELASARERMVEVLRPAAAEGAMRFLIDEGPSAAAVLATCQAGCDELLQGDPILADFLSRLLGQIGPAPLAEPDGARDPAAPISLDALTPKEIRLLRLLAEGYSNRALTEKLFVSDSTVRTHLRNINAKLGAANRTQAVAMARRLALIP